MSNTINNNNFFNSFFGTTRNTSQVNSMSNMLSDYASIRNGSYAKLLKNYYAKQAKADSSETSDETKKEKNELSQIKSDAASLSDKAAALYSDKSLFEQKYMTKTDEDGNKTTVKDYDRDTINKRINEFVESYNSMIKSAGDSDDTSVLRPTLNSTKRTQANSKMLAKAGISIEKDNTLKVDEEKLNSASISDLKSLFSGRNSYAYWTGSNASAVSNYTSSKLSDSSLYTKSAITYPEINSSTIEDYI